MSLNMCTRWALASIGGGLLALSACTADNPAYGGDAGDEDDPATSTSESEPTTTRTTGDPDATTRTTGDPDASASGSDVTTADTSEPGTGSESGDVLCSLHPEAWIEMEVTAVRFPIDLSAVDDPDVCEQIKLESDDGMLIATATGIAHQPCAECACGNLGEPPNEIDFGGSLEPMAVPVCGRLAAWTRFRPETSECVWDGFAVLPPAFDDFTFPHFFGSNSLHPNPAPLPGVLPSLSVVEACDNPLECDPKPGAHGLTFLDATVEVDAPEEIIFPDLEDATYEITNRMASIDQDCNERVSYTGVLVDGGGG